MVPYLIGLITNIGLGAFLVCLICLFIDNLENR